MMFPKGNILTELIFSLIGLYIIEGHRVFLVDVCYEIGLSITLGPFAALCEVG